VISDKEKGVGECWKKLVCPSAETKLKEITIANYNATDIKEKTEEKRRKT